MAVSICGDSLANILSTLFIEFKSGSMDQTIVVGRWEHSSTARIYINQSAACAAEIKFTSEQIHRMHTAAAYFKAL